MYDLTDSRVMAPRATVTFTYFSRPRPLVSPAPTRMSNSSPSPGVTCGPIRNTLGVGAENRESQYAATPIGAAWPTHRLAFRFAGRWQVAGHPDRRNGSWWQAPQERQQ